MRLATYKLVRIPYVKKSFATLKTSDDMSVSVSCHIPGQALTAASAVVQILLFSKLSSIELITFQFLLTIKFCLGLNQLQEKFSSVSRRCGNSAGN